MSRNTSWPVSSLAAIAVAGIIILTGSREIVSEASMKEKNQEQSGIEGVTEIKISPPVSREGEPEPEPRPFPTELAILAAGERREVTRFKTGSDGRFRVSLPPGEYIIKPLAASPRRGNPRASEHLAKVSAGQFIFVRIIFESGLQ